MCLFEYSKTFSYGCLYILQHTYNYMRLWMDTTHFHDNRNYKHHWTKLSIIAHSFIESQTGHGRDHSLWWHVVCRAQRGILGSTNGPCRSSSFRLRRGLQTGHTPSLWACWRSTTRQLGETWHCHWSHDNIHSLHCVFVLSSASFIFCDLIKIGLSNWANLLEVWMRHTDQRWNIS